jgi:glycerol-3-phosphate cytidylyltransferase
MKYKIGFIAGCFDVIHPGYIAAFKEAKSVCDHLIVGLHDDPSIERPEKARPILSLEDRIETLKSIIYIDDTITYSTEQDLVSILKSETIYWRIDVRFLGDDYRDRTDYTGYGLGIHIHFLSRNHGWSATSLKERIRSTS